MQPAKRTPRERRARVKSVSDPLFTRHEHEPSLVVRMHLERDRWSSPGHIGAIKAAVSSAVPVSVSPPLFFQRNAVPLSVAPLDQPTAHDLDAWKILYGELKASHVRRGDFRPLARRWRDETLIPWSVVAVELCVTLLGVGFFTISFWYGTWTLLDMAFAALFPGQPGRAIGATLGIGSTLLICAVVFGRLGLSAMVYKPLWPRTWGELFWRTGADRLIHYVQAWAGICIWKGVWDLWTTQVNILESRWVTAAVAHCVGLVALLLVFSFRGAALPPMVYTEDSIVEDSMMSRWNILSKTIWRHRKPPLQREWESNKVDLTPPGREPSLWVGEDSASVATAQPGEYATGETSLVL